MSVLLYPNFLWRFAVKSFACAVESGVGVKPDHLTDFDGLSARNQVGVCRLQTLLHKIGLGRHVQFFVKNFVQIGRADEQCVGDFADVFDCRPVRIYVGKGVL